MSLEGPLQGAQLNSSSTFVEAAGIKQQQCQQRSNTMDDGLWQKRYKKGGLLITCAVQLFYSLVYWRLCVLYLLTGCFACCRACLYVCRYRSGGTFTAGGLTVRAPYGKHSKLAEAKCIVPRHHV
jgi:hypothetical protein